VQYHRTSEERYRMQQQQIQMQREMAQRQSQQQFQQPAQQPTQQQAQSYQPASSSTIVGMPKE